MGTVADNGTVPDIGTAAQQATDTDLDARDASSG